MSHEHESVPIKDACYYLTLNITDWTDIFVKPVFKQIIAESLNYFVAKKGLTVYGWCLMTNHLHLIARAGNGQSLPELADDFKKFTTKIILEDLEAESEVRRNWILKKFRDAGKGFRFQQRLKVWQ
ncbi:MAG TPA: transposase, partial [Chitinophagaceae bacterium]